MSGHDISGDIHGHSYALKELLKHRGHASSALLHVASVLITGYLIR